MRRQISIVAALLAVGIVCAVDYFTGPIVGLSLFYLGPIVWIAWVAGSQPGIGVGVLAAMAWFIADMPYTFPEHGAASVWNAFTRLVIFAGGAWLVGRNRAAHDALTATNAQLKTLLVDAERLARTDAVTGLLNSRAFHDRLAAELARARRTNAALALAYIDLDHFKRVNDQFGHAAGDRVLMEIADELRRATREIDACARVGGDEFAVLFVDVGESSAKAAAERVLAQMAVIAAAYPGTALGASVGLIVWSGGDTTPQELLRAADALMYEVKAEGRGALRLRALSPALERAGTAAAPE